MGSTDQAQPDPQPRGGVLDRQRRDLGAHADRLSASSSSIVVAARRIGSAAWAWALGLLLGGALGNLTDRLSANPGPGRGHVVDFIDYFGLFIGNVADIAIVGAPW